MHERDQHGDLRTRLRSVLTNALKQRDTTAVGALRSAIAALDNAEAVDTALAPPAPPASAHVAGAVSGLGAAEVPRRELTESEAHQIVRAEIEQRREAAAEYERLGAGDAAARLRAEAAVLARELDGAS